jgi:hypothetical protein
LTAIGLGQSFVLWWLAARTIIRHPVERVPRFHLDKRGDRMTRRPSVDDEPVGV